MSCYNDTNISTNELSETSRIISGLQLHPGFLQNLLRDLGIIRSNLQHLQNYTSVKIVDNGDRQLVKDINSHFDNFRVSHLVHFTINFNLPPPPPPPPQQPLQHPFDGLFSRKTWVSRYQTGKTSLDLNEAKDDKV